MAIFPRFKTMQKVPPAVTATAIPPFSRAKAT